MKRWDIINKLIKDNDYQSYLEIGYGNGETYNQINIKNKMGVDINPRSGAKYIMSSENFFLFAKNNKLKYDIIFIDGNHKYEFVKKDVISSLEALNDGGTIVMHDCNPTKQEMQGDIPIIPKWTGSVWKVFVEFKTTRNDLKMYVVDTDYGCGIITKGSQILIKYEGSLDYTYLVKERKYLLNLISIDDFNKI
jgi:hypothetical protein